jgi:hypothetical protein
MMLPLAIFLALLSGRESAPVIESGLSWTADLEQLILWMVVGFGAFLAARRSSDRGGS